MGIWNVPHIECGGFYHIVKYMIKINGLIIYSIYYSVYSWKTKAVNMSNPEKLGQHIKEYLSKYRTF